VVATTCHVAARTRLVAARTCFVVATTKPVAVRTLSSFDLENSTLTATFLPAVILKLRLR